jgi:hypothetical protein
MYRMAAADMPAGAPPPEATYQAGDMTFTARVSAEYELIAK